MLLWVVVVVGHLVIKWFPSSIFAGLVHRLLAFELLLATSPELLGAVSLLQVCVPSRENVEEYLRLRHEVEGHVGRINGRFGRANWTPVRYLHRSYSQAELCGFYRDAAVCLVTPLRDGMILVAKEFCVAQVNDPGVLILSSLAGAAETMSEALIVNPYHKEALTLVRITWTLSACLLPPATQPTMAFDCVFSAEH